MKLATLLESFNDDLDPIDNLSLFHDCSNTEFLDRLDQGAKCPLAAKFLFWAHETFQVRGTGASE